ncbi:GIY-YIG nuclease family protein [Acetobacteraceae bacterium ESL0709]|nr:GIY-YIG nuclease family protein [Acetobacteraceae bacterium ESL0697]MDF7678888.1 GIY-YIG nuclease family protein [Acetobacteraceae bacterium ESL0709]
MERQTVALTMVPPEDHINNGIIYVLINPVMPGLVKIGITASDLPSRMKALHTTGVPVPFECVCAKQVRDCAKVESALHMAFGDHRVNEKREFFRIDPERVKAVINLLSGEEIFIDEDAGAQDERDIIALKSENRRASVFNFRMVDIVPGTTLEWLYDSAITCVVVDDRRIEFEGKVTSLSAAACEISSRTGAVGGAYQGPRYWKYQGKTLLELREEMEQGGE